MYIAVGADGAVDGAVDGRTPIQTIAYFRWRYGYDVEWYKKNIYFEISGEPWIRLHLN